MRKPRTHTVKTELTDEQRAVLAAGRADRARREAAGLVMVRRHWNDWLKTIEVPRGRLSGFHWTRYSGGDVTVAPRPFLHAYMLCVVIPDGAYFGHTCEHGPPPHTIKVCIVQSDNPRKLFAALAASATNDKDGA